MIKTPHASVLDDVRQELEVEPEKGLTSEQANQRQQEHGPNRLPEPEREGILKRFFKHFHDVLIYILIVAACVTALMGHWIDTIVIMGVVLINAIIGFLQEGKAEQALAGLRNMLSPHARVRRDGDWTELEAEALVPGDVVRLKAGDRVPADLRLADITDLQIEESALTGESAPVDKNTETVDKDAGLGDRTNMAFSGTLVTGGTGIGWVTAIGADTELGQINRMMADVETLETPLTRKMTDFGKVLSIVIVVTACLMGILGWSLHRDTFSLTDIFLAVIGFAVAAIPEGLPAILTITLALGVQRMARRNAITRRLNAVETLGSVTVICSDKTGTLTRNEMTVRDVVTPSSPYKVEGTGYAPEGSIQTTDEQTVTMDDHPELRQLVETFGLCNDARLIEKKGTWTVSGTPTEGALRVLAQKADVKLDMGERIAEVPFDSENKFMACLVRFEKDDTRLLLVGAPDRLLDRCSRQQQGDGETQPLERDTWEQTIESLSAKGLRVLAAAALPSDATELTIETIGEDLNFLGVAGILDPPREEAIKAVKLCKEAGIRVKMITGDHAGTAAAIGEEMGIGQRDKALTGADIEKASDDELQDLAQQYDVFARTSPEHKLRLVKALQARGEVVAMTGDGVNDAPALKRADVGIAMGIKGSEATKEAADIVLADDNFTSIERAVEEGRTIYDNLRKAILFILPTNGAQGLVMLAAVVFGLTLPLTPVQILWVNMIVAVTLALALAFEPPEPGIMKRPPRPPSAPILGWLFLWRIFLVSLLISGVSIAAFQVALYQGAELAAARTLAVNTLVCAQAFYLFNSRYLHEASLTGKRLFANPMAWLALALLAVLQLCFAYVPLMQKAFGTAAPDLHDWVIPLGTGIAILLIIELEKWLLRNLSSWRQKRTNDSR